MDREYEELDEAEGDRWGEVVIAAQGRGTIVTIRVSCSLFVVESYSDDQRGAHERRVD